MPALLAESAVTAIPAAAPQVALAHFERLLTLETDCWDVHVAVDAGDPAFVLLDVRSPELFAAGHVPTAINLPHRRINERNLRQYPKNTLSSFTAVGHSATELIGLLSGLRGSSDR